MKLEATHVADRKATYLYVYVQSWYLYVNLVLYLVWLFSEITSP